MNLLGYLRVLIVGILLLIGMVGGVFSVHSCMMEATAISCSDEGEDDCCCGDEADLAPLVADNASLDNMSCCKTISPYFNFPVFGVVDLIDINPVLIHCFYVELPQISAAALDTFEVCFSSDDPPDKIAGFDLLIRIEKFLI